MTPAVVLRRLGAALLVLVVLATFRDYGYSWDETWQNRWYGQAVLRFLGSLGEDRAATYTHNFHLYGGTFDVLAELLVAASPLQPRNARHLANAVAGLAGIAAAWAMARRLGGPAAGGWAALFLAVSAPWYGHMFINAKDIPFAAGHMWTLLLVLRWVDEFPAPRRRTTLLLGLALGLTLGVRVGGVVLLAYLLLFGAWAVGRQLLGEADRRAFLRGRLPAIAGSILAIVGVAWPLMVALWPAALLRPVAVPLEALRATNRFEWIGTLLWNGREVWSNDLPWSYLPVVYAVQLPEVLTLLFGASLVAGAALWLRARRAPSRAATARGLALLLLAVLFPVGWAIAMGSTLYDNGRHFLFVLPPLACLAALCWTWMLEAAQARRPGLGGLLAAGMAVALAPAVFRMASLHPYEYAFINRFGGGIPDGARRFDTDYWITSYREASRALRDHAAAVARSAGVPTSAARFTVAVVGPVESLAEELPASFTIVPYDPNWRADYLVATTRGAADRWWPDWVEVAEVGRGGMRFAVVKTAPDLVRWVPRLESWPR